MEKVTVNCTFVSAFIEDNEKSIRTAANISLHVDSIFNESVKGLTHSPVNYKKITGDESTVLEDWYTRKKIWSKKERHGLANKLGMSKYKIYKWIWDK